nr:MAG TPA: hypothetical protein [Caudoviricetes sp.]
MILFTYWISPTQQKHRHSAFLHYALNRMIFGVIGT